VYASVIQIDFEVTDELLTTKRGAGGFGSTGV
jgi:dUTPase